MNKFVLPNVAPMHDKTHENRPSKMPHELVHGAQIWPPKITVVYIYACRFIVFINSIICMHL